MIESAATSREPATGRPCPQNQAATSVRQGPASAGPSTNCVRRAGRPKPAPTHRTRPVTLVGWEIEPLTRRSSATIRPTRLRSCSIRSATRNMPGSTRSSMSTSTTPARACTPSRSFAITSRSSVTASSATRTRPASPPQRRPTSSSGTRRAVLDWFSASPQEYTAIFTANCTGALKHVGESFPFAPGGRLLLTFDNHNSVNGIREFARARGAAIEYAPLTMPELRLDRERLERCCGRRLPAPTTCSCFRRSRTSRACSIRSSSSPTRARSGGRSCSTLRRSCPRRDWISRAVPADFVTLSFYKMFGYPTAVGCLIARARRAREAATAVVRRRHRQLRLRAGPPPHPGAARSGVRGRHAQLPGDPRGGDRPAPPAANRSGDDSHARRMPDRLAAQAAHGSAPQQRPATWSASTAPRRPTMRGGIVTMNFYDPDGHLVDYRRVEELASERRISIRTGCFCNPGAGETAEGLTEEDVLAAVATGADLTLPRFLQIITHRHGKSAGAIRASFGIASNFADVVPLRAVCRRLARPDAPGHRRCDLRHRVLPRHPRRKLRTGYHPP